MWECVTFWDVQEVVFKHLHFAYLRDVSDVIGLIPGIWFKLIERNYATYAR